MLTDGYQVPLPSYEKPPVAEVAMSAHFATIPDLHIGHLGAYWQENVLRLPNLEQHPPSPPAEPEIFTASARSPGLRIELLPMASTPRFWLISDDRTLVVQIQQDRLVLNWRRVASGDDYPRFDFMRARFTDELKRFLDFLKRMGLRPPEQFNGEILYVNTILSGGTWTKHAEAPQVFRQMQALELQDGVVQAEDIRWVQRFTFANPTGELTGRLYSQVDPVTTDGGDPAFNLTLTARGGVSDGLDGLIDFMQAGRERIVRVFDAMTTTEMHEEWMKRT